MAELFANSEDPDQTPHSEASDLGLHCLPITIIRVSQLHCVNISVAPAHQWTFENNEDPWPEQMLQNAS